MAKFRQLSVPAPNMAHDVTIDAESMGMARYQGVLHMDVVLKLGQGSVGVLSLSEQDMSRMIERFSVLLRHASRFR
jgi:hypothetical protein